MAGRSKARSRAAMSVLLAGSALAAGCHNEIYDPVIDTPRPSQRGAPGGAAYGDAYAFCQNIEQHAARTSSAWAAISIVALSAGVPAAGIATGLGVNELTKRDPDRDRLAVDGVILGAGLLGVFLGAYGLARSEAASSASAQASRGLANSDESKAWDDCISARATWVESREKAIEDLRKERDHYRKQLEAKSTAEAADAGAQDASTQASDPSSPGR